MRFIPRRKRTWLLVLLAVAVIGAASIWLVISAKSDFEKRYDELKVGMPFSEALALAAMNGSIVENTSFQIESTRYVRCIAVADDGERVELLFRDDRLTVKGFTPVPKIVRLRSLWFRWLKSKPPF